MSFILDTFARAAFKRLVGKSHTANTRDPANEPISSNFTLSAKTIWAEDASKSVLVTLTLEGISGTANTGKYAAYRCKIPSVPAGLVGKINRQTGAAYAPGDYVGDIVPQSFGDAYRPKLFRGAVETPPLDASDWFLDASAGVVTQEEDTPVNMIDYSTTGTLQAYVYTGAFVGNMLVNYYEDQTIGAGITGDVNGSNCVFTIAHTPIVGSVQVYLNGLRTTDYAVSGNTLTLGSSSAPVFASELLVCYRT